MICNRWFRRKTSFLEKNFSWADAGTVILGVPMDSTSSYRPGARFAPEEIRKVFDCLENYSLELDADFSSARVHDLGDLILPTADPQESLFRVEKVVTEIVKQGKKPLLIGGDHSITYAPVCALFSNGYPDLAVLHFDAHFDLRPRYLGEEISHASVIYRIVKRGIKHIYQFGIRSADAAEVDVADRNTKYFSRGILAALKRTIEELEDRPVYVTVDIDVVDPAYAPGTGTPEPGGITSTCLLRALTLIRDLNLVGFDLVEVNPAYDHGQITTILGAKIIREAILILEGGRNHADGRMQ
ncbi:MAG: agmatinase [Firmicutes bacterium]|nr:agmatinase [Bacillota bacterium]